MNQYNQYGKLREKENSKKEIVEIKQEIEELKSLLKEVLKMDPDTIELSNLSKVLNM